MNRLEVLKLNVFGCDQTAYVMAKGARLSITKNASIHPCRPFLQGSGSALIAKSQKLKKFGLSARLAPLGT